MFECWSEDPTERPTFEQIRRTLTSLVDVDRRHLPAACDEEAADTIERQLQNPAVDNQVPILLETGGVSDLLCLSSSSALHFF
jgi:hypothetical protein